MMVYLITTEVIIEVSHWLERHPLPANQLFNKDKGEVQNFFSYKWWRWLANIADYRWSLLDICVYFWQFFWIGWEVFVILREANLRWFGWVRASRSWGDIWSYLVLSNMVGKYRISFDFQMFLFYVHQPTMMIMIKINYDYVRNN